MKPILFLALLISGVAWGGALPPQVSGGSEVPSLAPMLDRTTQGVVNIAIYTSVQIRSPLYDFFGIPDERRRFRREQSTGSGVIVDAENGYIVTNHHVIERADEIVVGLADGRRLPATLIGSDPLVDLAVLQVESDRLEALEFADSSAVRVGDFVVAIGNPFGLDRTVTSGIVSALGRTGLGLGRFEAYIQTDASVNPGNSGGALVDLTGKVVGINTAIVSPQRSSGSVGIGFAIPSDLVRAIMTQLVEHGEVRRARIGLDVIALNPDEAAVFAVKAGQGVLVGEVEPGSVADVAGIQAGDVLTRIGLHDIRGVADYDSAEAVIMVGDIVDVDAVRDGKARLFRLEVDERVVQVAGERVDPRLAGATLSDFRAAGDPRSGAGVLVVDVDRNSPAWTRDLRSGDVIVGANGQRIHFVGELWRRIQNSRAILRIYREGQYGNLRL